MLSEEERNEITWELKSYPTKQAVSIEALKIVQQHRGWVSDEAVDDVATFLEMSVEEVDGVATFYNDIFRHPVGRRVIRLCDSVSCWIMGYRTIREELLRRLGPESGQTADNADFTLIQTVCLGACDHAPVMMVDEDLHGNLTPERLDEILSKYK